MKKRNIIFLAVMVVALLCITIGAMAECEPGQHNFRTTTIKEPTCNETGVAVQQCTICGYKLPDSERTVEKKPHDYIWKPSVAATCTSTGQEYQVCRACGTHGETRSIDALGHNLGSAVTIKSPSCTETGTSRKTCTRCSYFEDSPIDALGHNLGSAVTIKSPSCTETGTSRKTCTRCSYFEDSTINALGHLWGTGVTTPATCIAPATTTRICQRDSSHKEITTSGSVDDNAHVWGDWKVSKKPTCTTPGQETRVCKLSSAHTQTRDTSIEPDAHVWDNGTYIVKPTTTSGGEIKYVCQLNSDHTKTVKVGPLARGGNNTVCAFGPRLRDTNLYPNNTDAWYMFTPFDASQDGVQTFELIATNKYIVGTVTLTIQDGNLKVDYSLKDPGNFKATLEFFTVLNRINDLTDYEPENLMHLAMNKGQFINLQENFGDDTNLVLYFCTRCNFTYSNKISTLDYESVAHQRQLQNMLALMD